MTIHDPRAVPRRALQAVVMLAAVLVGLRTGYEFGHRVTGGPLLGVVTALMNALFCSILASAALEWALRRIGSRRRASS